MTPKRKYVPGRVELILFFVSCVLSFSMLEVLLRVMEFPSKVGIATASSPNASLYGWAPLPNDAVFISHPDGGRGWWDYTNSAGWKDVEHHRVPTSGVVRILIVGDSFTYGTVPLHALYTRILEQRLREAGIAAEVISIGVGGWGTDQELLALQYDGLKYAPDIVIYQYFSNDLTDNLYPHPGLSLDHVSWNKGFRFVLSGEGLVALPVPRPALSSFEPIKRLVLKSAVIWNVNRLRSSLMQGARGAAPPSYGTIISSSYPINPYEVGELSDDTEYALHLWRELVKRMKQSSEAAGAQFLVFSMDFDGGARDWRLKQKMFFTDDHGEYVPVNDKRYPVSYDRPRLLLSTILQEEGITLIPNTRKYERWIHDSHINEAGNLAAAEDMRDFLLSHETARAVLMSQSSRTRNP